MTILCLWIPHLPLQVALVEQPALAEQPVIIAGQPWDEERVLDCSSQARLEGVVPGQRLSVAAGHCPTAIVIPADTDTYHTLHQTVYAVLSRHTEQIETLELGQCLASLPHTNKTRRPGHQCAPGRALRFRGDFSPDPSPTVAPRHDAA